LRRERRTIVDEVAVMVERSMLTAESDATAADHQKESGGVRS